MQEMPLPAQPALRRLARRLAIGLFLDIWSRLAAATLILAGGVVLVCRVFFPDASAWLPWLMLGPVVAAIPVLFVCMRRAYRPDQVLALADWLGGGTGLLLALGDRHDSDWHASSLLARATRFEPPRLRPWRRLAPIAPAFAFLALALWLPQRTPARDTTALADEIAADLAATVTELKQQNLITETEEKTLEEEIERIRRDAAARVDGSTWEAADALREKMSAGLGEKQDALKWAQESLGRYAEAAKGGGASEASADATRAELVEALQKLADSGLLAGAPAGLLGKLKAGTLPADPKTLGDLAGMLSKYLTETGGRLRAAGQAGRGGKFDPAEFPLDAEGTSEESNQPGRGGITRGRADADMIWGDPTARHDRFKAQALPPGAARSPDDWAPVTTLPGTPQEAARLSSGGAIRQYDATAGQSAWRRSLAPRHQSAVKKYFQK